MIRDGAPGAGHRAGLADRQARAPRPCWLTCSALATCHADHLSGRCARPKRGHRDTTPAQTQAETPAAPVASGNVVPLRPAASIRGIPRTCIDAADAAELTEMLQLIADWLAADPATLAPSPLASAYPVVE